MTEVNSQMHVGLLWTQLDSQNRSVIVCIAQDEEDARIKMANSEKYNPAAEVRCLPHRRNALYIRFP